MWVSKKTRYGLRMLVELAINQGELITLKEIGNREGISNKYLEQIVTALRKAKYVEAKRGPRGGYRLIKDPKDITLLDVFMLFEGQGAIVECISDPKLCERSGHCKSRAIWCVADKRINETLRSIRLVEIVEQFNKEGALVKNSKNLRSDK